MRVPGVQHSLAPVWLPRKLAGRGSYSEPADVDAFAPARDRRRPATGWKRRFVNTQFDCEDWKQRPRSSTG